MNVLANASTVSDESSEEKTKTFGDLLGEPPIFSISVLKCQYWEKGSSHKLLLWFLVTFLDPGPQNDNNIN